MSQRVSGIGHVEVTQRRNSRQTAQSPMSDVVTAIQTEEQKVIEALYELQPVVAELDITRQVQVSQV